MKLSVIICTINRDKEVARCLESLKQQTDKEFEVIVVDLSKNRRTKTVCRPYNLKYYRPKKRKNLSHARNFGVNMSAAEIVAFINDDAEAMPNWVEQIKATFNEPELSFVAGKVTDISSLENPCTIYQNGMVGKYGDLEMVTPENKYRQKGKFLVPSSANMAYKKRDLMAIGGFDEVYNQNLEACDLALRLQQKGKRGIYSGQVEVTQDGSHLKDRKGSIKIKWRGFAKSMLYFGLKNGSLFMPFRIIKSLLLAFSGYGAFGMLLGRFLQGKMSIFNFIKNWFLVNLGSTQAFYKGVFGKRQLVHGFNPITRFVFFTKRI